MFEGRSSDLFNSDAFPDNFAFPVAFCQNFFLNLQQRRLFRIYTGIPFSSRLGVNLVWRKTTKNFLR